MSATPNVLTWQCCAGFALTGAAEAAVVETDGTGLPWQVPIDSLLAMHVAFVIALCRRRDRSYSAVWFAQTMSTIAAFPALWILLGSSPAVALLFSPRALVFAAAAGYALLASPADLIWTALDNGIGFAALGGAEALFRVAMLLSMAASPSWALWVMLCSEALSSHAIAVTGGRSPAGAWATALWAMLLAGTPGASANYCVGVVGAGALMFALRLRLVASRVDIEAGAALRALGAADPYFAQPETKKAYNSVLFTVVAPSYDFITRALSFGQDASWKRGLMTMLPQPLAPFPAAPAADKRRTSRRAASTAVDADPSASAGVANAQPVIVDIACGTGDLCRALAARYPEARVLGTDLTPRMIELASALHVLPNVEFSVQNMCALELPSGTVSLLTGSYALRNAPSLASALVEVERVLAPDGTAAFLDFSKPESRAFGAVQYGLLHLWGSLWGLLVHGDPRVYAYIAESLQAFPPREQLAAVFADAGLELVERRRLFLGFIEVLIARKARK
eukprot:c32974_g1_i1.p1 GENE.c32974_g1_i1~~c32974_g1_i1.p1  ORF type:complete len:530 (+),score=70.38 c32974_g1_i1:66-1592(+)